MHRIRELRRSTSLSMRETAARLGIPYTTYVNYEKGDREPGHDMLLTLADHFNVTVDYLIGHTDAPQDTSVSPKIHRSNGEIRHIPLLGVIACGSPLWAKENVEELLPCPPMIDADFCLRCRGDSMIDAGLRDGDLVYIKQQSTVENGQIAAVLIGEEATLKRVYLQGDTLILQPENANFRPLVFRGQEMEEIRILGRAVWFCGRIR